jgi:acyl carrier protein
MTMTENEILSLMQSALDQVAPGWSKAVKDFGPQVKFKDLSVDSVQIMEMVGIIEDRCNCQFADEDLAHVNKVGDMVSLIRKVAA